MRAWIIALSLVVIGIAANASAADLTDSEAMHEAFEEIRILKIQTVSLADKSLSCVTANHCAKIPMGSRACGGPTMYFTTSILDQPAYEAVVEQAKQVTAKEAELNEKYGTYSICSIEMPPAVDCIENTCKIVK